MASMAISCRPGEERVWHPFPSPPPPGKWDARFNYSGIVAEEALIDVKNVFSSCQLHPHYTSLIFKGEKWEVWSRRRDMASFQIFGFLLKHYFLVYCLRELKREWWTGTSEWRKGKQNEVKERVTMTWTFSQDDTPFLWLWHAVISRWLWIVARLNLNENTAFIQVHCPLWQSPQIPKQITDRDIELFAEHDQVYLHYSCWFSGISNSFQWGRFACFSMLNGTAGPRQKRWIVWQFQCVQNSVFT